MWTRSRVGCYPYSSAVRTNISVFTSCYPPTGSRRTLFACPIWSCDSSLPQGKCLLTKEPLLGSNGQLKKNTSHHTLPCLPPCRVSGIWINHGVVIHQSNGMVGRNHCMYSLLTSCEYPPLFWANFRL